MKPRSAHQEAGRQAFTLLEIIIAVSILAVLAGVAVPLVGKAFESKAKSVTSNELDELSESVGMYFFDVGAFPAEIDDLWIEPNGATGWTGPYISSSSTDPLSGKSDWTVDAWSRDYVLYADGDVLTITSTGGDASVGTADDLSVEVDVTHIRRDKTYAALAIINQAVQLYNAANLPTSPLPTSYTMLVEELVDDGLLPATDGFEVDGWGDAYTPVPAGQSPVVLIGSTNLGDA
ncbi:MAG: type II secretion system protein GspG [Planctomycetota bacterium]